MWMQAVAGQEGTSAHDAMQGAWDAYAANPRGAGRYRAYVEARERLIAVLVAAKPCAAPGTPEHLAWATAALAFPLQWIGDRYGWDAELGEG